MIRICLVCLYVDSLAQNMSVVASFVEKPSNWPALVRCNFTQQGDV
jgi:hypothetical protein